MVSASCVNTTTSHAPRAGLVSTASVGGSCAFIVNVGNRFSNTATSHGPAGTSVGWSPSVALRKRVVPRRRQKGAVLPMAGVRHPLAAERVPAQMSVRASVAS